MGVKMEYKIDRFKINWTERIKGKYPGDPAVLITSVTGYNYQIENWKINYFKEFKPKRYKTKVMTKIFNADDTVTITVSRLI